MHPQPLQQVVSELGQYAAIDLVGSERRGILAEAGLLQLRPCTRVHFTVGRARRMVAAASGSLDRQESVLTSHAPSLAEHKVPRMGVGNEAVGWHGTQRRTPSPS